jgi:MarR family transcriptional regulator for hemolysin
MATKRVTISRARKQSLGYLLVDAVRLMREDFRERSKGLKLTPALARLLFNVHRQPGSRQADLAARLEVTPVTVGRMLDRLAKCGYVRRLPDTVDRRAFRVYVGRAGEPLIGRMDRIRAQTEARAMRGLAAHERTVLARRLSRICENLGSKSA